MLSPSSSRATFILRLGLAGVFAWFGASQVLNQGPWISLIPAWVPTTFGMGAAAFVILNGIAELIAAAALAFGVLTRWVALLLCLHLVTIVLDVGLDAVGVRDVGLAVMAFALFVSENDPWALMPTWPKKTLPPSSVVQTQNAPM